MSFFYFIYSFFLEICEFSELERLELFERTVSLAVDWMDVEVSGDEFSVKDFPSSTFRSD